MTHVETKSSPQKRILLTCLIATLGIHVGAFFYFYKFPPMLPLSWHDLFAKTLPTLKMIPKEDVDTILEEFFDPFPEISTLFILPYDLETGKGAGEGGPRQEALSAMQTAEIHILTESEQHDFPLPELSLAFSSQIPQEQYTFTLPDYAPLPFSLMHHQLSNRLSSLSLPVETDAEEKTPVAVGTTPEQPPTQLKVLTRNERTALPFFKLKPHTLAGTTPSIATQSTARSPLLQEQSVGDRHWTSKKPALAITFENANVYDLPKTQIVEFDADNFDADVRLMKAPGKKGYHFSVSLKPTKNASIQKMRHNFTFLIDRSNSIEKHHFTSFKKAALRALSMLQIDDTFNIVVFDKKAVSFSETPIPYSKAALEAAENFLNKQKSGGLFAAADLYEFLLKLIPAHTPEDEVSTLILITDGTTDAPLKKQQAAIKRFLETNKSKTTLYTAAVAHGNDLKLLDLISTSTGGSMIYSDTYAAFSRRLAGLVYRLRDPVAKEITVTSSCQDPDAALTIYPPTSTVFYTGQPYEIVGKIEKLTDFTLLIEGIHEGEPLRIKKTISFAHAKNDSTHVTKLWNTEKTKNEHKQFLEKGKKPATRPTANPKAHLVKKKP